MDRRERGGDPQIGMLAALDGWQSTLWTSLPGIVQSFNPAKQTAVIQPTLQAQIQMPDGSFYWTTLPLLLDCPVFFPKGGGITLTFPVKLGDECLVIFASRCIDAWWNAGGIQIQAEFRMHDLSDGFAYVGVSSVPNVIPNISTTKAQLRNDAGTTYVEVDPAGNVAVVTTGNTTVNAGGNVSVSAGGNATVSASGSASVSAGGALNLSGSSVNITGTLNINGAPFLAHHHSGIQTGSGQTGSVV